MKVNIADICCSKFNKINDALEKSDFNLATNLAQDMIRTADYVGFKDGIFIGEFFENVFSNMRFIVSNYEVEDEIINESKEKIKSMINALAKLFPFEEDARKIRTFDLMSDIRMSTTKLQLECYRGEKKRKKRSGLALPPFPPEIIARIEEDIE